MSALTGFRKLSVVIVTSSQANEMNNLKVALLQINVVADKSKNINHALNTIRNTVKNNQTELCILPECFTGSYSNDAFAQHAEFVPNGEACIQLSKISKELGIYIIGGSIIEKDDKGKMYNTCTIWSPEGKLIGKHRKLHLFDIKIKPENNGGVSFKESDTLTAGKNFTIVEIKNHKIGLGICHDKRFDELARIYRNEGCEMIVYPSAFCICQGPMHWELLQRSRANDNQLYVLTCAPARDPTTDYVAYGHSMVIDPWGTVLFEASEKEEIIIADIDFTVVQEVREQIPIFNRRRIDIYNTLKTNH